MTFPLKSTNELLTNNLSPSFHYDKKSLKRRRYLEPKSGGRSEFFSVDIPAVTELDTADEQKKILMILNKHYCPYQIWLLCFVSRNFISLC